MSATDDAREHLTAVIWEVLRNYTSAPLVHHADMIHTAAERYGHALSMEGIAGEAGRARLKAAAAEYYGASR